MVRFLGSSLSLSNRDSADGGMSASLASDESLQVEMDLNFSC